MKKLISLLALCFLSTGCSSCSRHDTTKVVPVPVPTVSASAQPVPEVVPPTLVTENGWSIMMPSGFEKVGADDAGIGLFVNKDKEMLISLSKETFTGSSDQYVLTGIKSLKDKGITAIEAKQVKINGVDFVVLECDQEGIHAWIWAGARNGFGYALSCGGKPHAVEMYDTCFSTMNTFKIVK